MTKLVGSINPFASTQTIYTMDDNYNINLINYSPSMENFNNSLIEFSNKLNIDNIIIASQYDSFASGIAQQIEEELELNYGINDKIIEVVKL